MHFRFYFFILLFLLPACGSLNQSTTSVKSSASKHFIETESFAISRRPILNREYALFLAWYISVYGESYPGKVLNIIPGAASYGEDFFIDDFSILLNNPNSFIYQYILNPKYLDYPLLGLSKDQALEMNRWMSDRYNEYLLIEGGYLNFNMAQKDEDCFSTEAYLSDQYTGSVRNAKVVKWEDDLFVPTFRLPYEMELATLKLKTKDANFFRPYSFKQKDFLWRWNEILLTIDKANATVKLNLYDSITLIESDQYPLLSNKIEAATLVNRELEFKSVELLKEVALVEKNYFGQMHYVIVGRDAEGQAIVASPLSRIDKAPLQTKMFWMAFNKAIPSQYLPK